MVIINGNFIGSFKLGDNIQYNLATLRLLYRHFNAGSPDDQLALCKPIIVIISSVIEAALHDFAFRARTHTREQSLNVSTLLLNLFRKAPNDKLAFYIDQVRKHDVFNDPAEQIYNDLDDLRKLRNRVHIQNTEGYMPLDENRAFIPSEKIRAEKLLEKIMKFMHDNHSRPIGAQFGQDFELPWNAHYT